MSLKIQLYKTETKSLMIKYWVSEKEGNRKLRHESQKNRSKNYSNPQKASFEETLIVKLNVSACLTGMPSATTEDLRKADDFTR